VPLTGTNATNDRERAGGIRWRARIPIRIGRRLAEIGVVTSLLLGAFGIETASAQGSSNLPVGLRELLQGAIGGGPGGAAGTPSQVLDSTRRGEEPRPLEGLPGIIKSYLIFTEPEHEAIAAFCRAGGVGIERLPRPQVPESEEVEEADLTISAPPERRVVPQAENILAPGAKGTMVIVGIERYSRLERDYCARIRGPIFQFGYENFQQRVPQSFIGTGAISDDYSLGVGDRLIITFHGQKSGTHQVTIDREGRAIVSNLLPIGAAGRTFGDFRRELEARTAAAYIGTGVFVSLGAVRQVTVAVVGEVRVPGVYRLTGLSSIIDAINLAGGVRKTGSLRKVIIKRSDQVFIVDLYDLLLTGGVDYDLNVFDGDRIFLPTIGGTVAVAGQVNRPGIYELPEGRSTAKLAPLLRHAGGTIRPSGRVFYKASFTADGRETVSEIDPVRAEIGAGDIVFVQPLRNIQAGTVELAGHVTVPGRRALASAPTVRALVDSRDNLGDDPYLLLAVLETTDPTTRSRRLFPINLQKIFSGEEDYSLREKDRLFVLARSDVRYLMSTDVKNVILERPVEGLSEELSATGGGRRAVAENFQISPLLADDKGLEELLAALSGSEDAQDELKARRRLEIRERQLCPGLKALASIVSVGGTRRFESAIHASFSAATLAYNLRADCPPIYRDNPEVLPFVLEQVVAMNGEVRRPGAYPVTSKTRLASLVSAAGGLTRDTDQVQIELSRVVGGTGDVLGRLQRQTIDFTADGGDNTLIEPTDILRFGSRFTDRDRAPVELSGEFMRPGLYTISKGERLSDLIRRAGGMTEQAYAYGAIFTRLRVKRAEALALRRASREINFALSLATVREDVDVDQLAPLARLATQVETAEALGRVVIEADPTVLQARPELDTVLESGDRLFVPKRPNFVTISGQVLNPATVQFRAEKTVTDYIDNVGGFRLSADGDRTFVVLPNGEARRVAVSDWSLQRERVPPGSTIVVPTDPKPFDLLEFAEDVVPILSNLAITATAFAVLADR
jgi:protein involved in polysaccharide export with SLBB domain